MEMAQPVFTSSTATAPGFPVATLDNEAAGAVENPQDAELHVDPYDAAKQIRHKARNLRDWVMMIVNPQSSQQASSMFASKAKDAQHHMGALRVNGDYVASRLLRARERVVRCLNESVEGGAFERAITERKAAAGKEFLANHRYLLASSRDAIQLAENYNGKALTNAVKINALLNEAIAATQGPVPTTGDSPQVAEARKKVNALCDEIHVLAQSLPTIPNAPVEKNQMILRAVATLLKNGGFLESSITTEGATT